MPSSVFWSEAILIPRLLHNLWAFLPVTDLAGVRLCVRGVCILDYGCKMRCVEPLHTGRKSSSASPPPCPVPTHAFVLVLQPLSPPRSAWLLTPSLLPLCSNSPLINVIISSCKT